MRKQYRLFVPDRIELNRIYVFALRKTSKPNWFLWICAWRRARFQTPSPRAHTDTRKTIDSEHNIPFWKGNCRLSSQADVDDVDTESNLIFQYALVVGLWRWCCRRCETHAHSQISSLSFTRSVCECECYLVVSMILISFSALFIWCRYFWMWFIALWPSRTKAASPARFQRQCQIARGNESVHVEVCNELGSEWAKPSYVRWQYAHINTIRKYRSFFFLAQIESSACAMAFELLWITKTRLSTSFAVIHLCIWKRLFPFVMI